MASVCAARKSSNEREHLDEMNHASRSVEIDGLYS